jgi:hypothetical protein
MSILTKLNTIIVHFSYGIPISINVCNTVAPFNSYNNSYEANIEAINMDCLYDGTNKLMLYDNNSQVPFTYTTFDPIVDVWSGKVRFFLD